MLKSMKWIKSFIVVLFLILLVKEIFEKQNCRIQLTVYDFPVRISVRV